MFTFSSFRKLLFGVTVSSGGIVFSCFYVYKKNRPLNDYNVDVPSEKFRIKVFDDLAKNYDEKNDFVEKITSISKYKKKNFRKVRGVVLEIGAGTGRNFNFFKNIDALVCVEKSEKMCEQLKKKIEKINPPYPVYVINNDIKNSYFKPDTFDSVVSSFSLCSLEHVDECLQQVYEVMKQDGKFFLVERGIIYNKFIRYILEKFDLYPNRKIPWEYGYYENRSPLDILKNNGFNITFKMIKNAGSIYILIAKKIKRLPNKTLNENNQIYTNQSADKDTPKKKEIHINEILLEKDKVPIYYIHTNDLKKN
ncbi:methyltransferase, putative [Plasmodium chabaudi chabaudi]|uniref:Methyltransferase, putative n=1 Tax=Plasmodium chabaudi chabaudi TaxID=31271 RepID=A0A4V0K0D9_PLACU|nr:methyltransferase, putative [Plasmodium chabaudi chabaudi]VTZ66392.1 methyltransferase, putative [Plasmodium chabaudi chabaudi]|eukprot:XP_016655498.1 methyltransferase, putative [Plasmodium chabaudi chabaudi]